MEHKESSDVRRLFYGTIILVAFGLLGITAYSMDVPGWATGFHMVSLSALIGAAFGLLGILLGFLFGIPRTLSAEEEVKTIPEKLSAEGQPFQPGRAPVSYRVNTNLEQISDWLTKILVGVGLTQLQNIPDMAWQVAHSFGTALPPGSERTGFVLAVMVYAAASGFLLGYLWTRVVLAPMFQAADKKLFEREQQVKRFEERLKDLDDTLTKMHDHLYEYEREGFRQTIAAAQQFRNKWGAPTEALYWIRLAAAYGQQYRWEQEKSVSLDARQQTKRSAFEAIDEALKIDKALAKYFLNYLGNPDYPEKPKDENDLEVFWSDDEFQRRVKA